MIQQPLNPLPLEPQFWRNVHIRPEVRNLESGVRSPKPESEWKLCRYRHSHPFFAEHTNRLYLTVAWKTAESVNCLAILEFHLSHAGALARIATSAKEQGYEV